MKADCSKCGGALTKGEPTRERGRVWYARDGRSGSAGKVAHVPWFCARCRRTRAIEAVGP